MRTTSKLIAAVMACGAAASCHAKPDLEDRCHDIVEHMRKVSAMPMRDADVAMYMGACKMWMGPMMECMEATTSDADIAKCRAMDKP